MKLDLLSTFVGATFGASALLLLGASSMSAPQVLTAEQQEILGHFSLVEMKGADDAQYKTLRLSGVNLQLVNGGNATDEGPRGLGNLIVGYNESPSAEGSIRTGRHNLVIGRNHSYMSDGGVVMGFENSVSGKWSSVTGGVRNLAAGTASSVNGGEENQATGSWSTVAGGQGNVASGSWATASGGHSNESTGSWSAILGGESNEAYGSAATVAGGHEIKVSRTVEYLGESR